MTGHALITGATNGIGRATARALAQTGMALTVLYRNELRFTELEQELAGADISGVYCDLSSLASVSAAAEQVLARNISIDVLINNAGLITTRRETSEDGHELMFAANHLGHFLLTLKLLPLLKQSDSPQVISVASEGHRFAKPGFNFDNLHWERDFSSFKAYGSSKLCNMLFTLGLVGKHGKWLRANCLHPGAVSTGMGAQNGRFAKFIIALLRPFFRSPERGADSSIWLALNDKARHVQGEYIIDCKAAVPEPFALDKDAADQLWQLSEQLVGEYLL